MEHLCEVRETEGETFLVCGHVKFEILMRWPSGDIRYAVVFLSMEHQNKGNSGGS